VTETDQYYRPSRKGVAAHVGWENAGRPNRTASYGDRPDVASTDQHNGFRLPWSGASGARPDAADEVDDRLVRAADETADEVAAAQSGIPAASAPNRFQPILLRAMRAAAEESRNGMLAACHEDAKVSITGLHARSAAESETLRRLATAEIAAMGESSKADIERIRAEADQSIAARRAELAQSLEDQAARVELEIETTRAAVAAFEADMSAFFSTLETVGDPAEFAVLTAQMPEPPPLRGAGDDVLVLVPANPPSEPAAAVPAKTPQAPAATKTAPESPPAPVPSGSVVTTLVVVGLVNIASIASFKRHVSGLHGIKSVAVSSGAGGEFVFKVVHEAEVALGDEVTLLPGFSARIAASHEGVLQVTARDPGVAA